MKAIKLTICIFTILFFATTSAAAEQHEVLLGVSMDYEKGEITIEVVSTGCTYKSDFRFEYRDNTLTIIRLRRDTCKAMPRKISLTFSLEETGIDPHTPFHITNAFVTNEDTANFIMSNTQ